MDFSNWVNVVVVAVPVVLALAGLGYGVYMKLKSKKYVEAAQTTGKILEEAVKAVDIIKTATKGTPSREAVGTALKGMGNALDNAGLKVKLDDVVKGLGLDNKS